MHADRNYMGENNTTTPSAVRRGHDRRPCDRNGSLSR